MRTNSGYKFMKASNKAKTYRPPSKLKKATLPKIVDLRPFMPPIENQGQTNSCTANAVVSACEYLLKRTKKNKFFDVSRLFVYYNARWRKGKQNEDGGSVIQFAVESLQKFGACSENTWQFSANKSIITKQPSQKAYKEAKEFRISNFRHVEVKLGAWKKCLAEGYPIIFGCSLFGSFDSCSKNGGIVPMPSPQDTSRGSHGAHAMLCVGYSDYDQLFIIRNSWGENWGDKGYCYMPYNYLMSNFNFGDNWILKSLDNIPDIKETWQTKSKSGKKTVVNAGKGMAGYSPKNNNPYSPQEYESFNPFELDDIEFIDEEDGGEYVEDVPEDLYEYYSEIYDGEENFDDEFDDFEDEEEYDEEDDEDFYGEEASLDDLEEEEYDDSEEGEEEEEEEEYDDSEEGEEEEEEEEYDDSEEGEEEEEEEEYDDSEEGEEEEEEEEYDDSEEEEEEYDDSEEEEEEYDDSEEEEEEYDDSEESEEEAEEELDDSEESEEENHDDTSEDSTEEEAYDDSGDGGEEDSSEEESQ